MTLMIRRRAALDQLGERLLDAKRNIGQPNKLTVIFGRKITRQHHGKLQTVIEDLNLPNPVIRSHYKNGFLKQYVRDDRMLRTELATNNVTDYSVGKAVENLPQISEKFRAITDRGFHPLMRVKAGGSFRPDGWHAFYPLSSFAAREGTRFAAVGTAYRTAPLGCTLLAMRAAGCADAWLVVTDLPASSADPCWYALRSWIELDWRSTVSTKVSEIAGGER